MRADKAQRGLPHNVDDQAVTAAQSRTSVERTNTAPATMSGPPAIRAKTGHSVRAVRSIRRDRKTRRIKRSARVGIHVGRIVAYVRLRPHAALLHPATRPPHLDSRPWHGPGLSFGLIHPRTGTFTSGHPDYVRAARGRWRTPVNSVQHCWKACWGQPLRSSNLLSSATLACKNIGE